MPLKTEMTLTDVLLREFLLGKLKDEELERVECLFLTDSQTRDRILAAEHDLIDDYLEQSLSDDEEERFVSRYQQTAEQRQKLKIAKAIKDRAVLEFVSRSADTFRLSSWRRPGTRLRLEARFVIPIVVTVMLAIVVAVVLLNRPERRKGSDLAFEHDLARMNDPASLSEVPPQMVTVELLPGTTRSTRVQAEVKMTPQIRIIEFHLISSGNQAFVDYEAEIRRLDSDESFVVPNLRRQHDSYYLKLRLPTQILKRGQYQIYLNATTANGSRASVEDYTFTLVE